MSNFPTSQNNDNFSRFGNPEAYSMDIHDCVRIFRELRITENLD